MGYDVRFDVVQTGAETIDQITSKMTVMKAQITAVGLEMRQAGNRVADAQKQIAEGATFLAPVLKKEEDALAALVVKQREQKAALDALTPAIEKTTTATVQAAEATVKLGAAHSAAVPQVAAASAAIRVFEGALPIRAVERFAVNILGLGPLLQNIFPVIGAIAFGEVILRTGEKVLKMAGLWGGVTEAEKAATAEAQKLDQQIQQIGKSIKEINLQRIIIQNGATAGKATTAAQGPANELTAQFGVNASYASLAAPLKKLLNLPSLDLTDNDAIQRALNTADAIARTPARDRDQALARLTRGTVGAADFAKGYTALAPLRRDLQVDQETKERFHDQSLLDSANVIQGSADDAQTQRNTQIERDNAAAAERRRQETAAREVRTRNEERAKSTGELGRKALSPVDAIYARDDETRRDFAAKGNAFTPGELLQRNAGVTADANAELTKQAYAQRNDFESGGIINSNGNPQLLNKNKRDQQSTLGPDGENDLKRVFETTISWIREVNAEHNKQATETGAALVRQNAIRGASADKQIERNPELSDAQKIAAINLQDLDTQRQKLQIQLQSASQLSTEKERKDAIFQAGVSNEEALTKIKEDNLDRLASLEKKQVEEFRSLVGGLFDAVASRQPNAVPNFIKSQVLGVGKTVAENVASEYLLKPLQKMIPNNPGGPLGKILAGTGLVKDAKTDPLKLSTDLNTSATDRNTAVLASLRAQAMSLSGGGGGAVAGGNILGGPGGGGDTDVYGNPISPAMGNDGLPISGGGLNVALAQSAGLAKNGGMQGGGPLANSVEGPLFDPNASMASKVTSGIATAGVIAGGAIAAYKGFSKGGAQGALDGIGSIAGTAAALDPEPISKAILAVTAIALPLIGSFFNGPQKRANAINTELGAAQYNAPTALNATQSSSGDFADFDARGNLRTSNFSSIPTVREGSTWEQTHGLFGGPPTFYQVPGGQTGQFGAANGGSTAPVAPITIHVSAIDTQSALDFIDKNHAAVGAAAAKSMQNIHGALSTEVQRAANP